jgi:hypothetical protein
MSEYEKLPPEGKQFSELPVGAVFIPFPIGNTGNRLLKIKPGENPQFGLINSLNLEWLLIDVQRQPSINLYQRIERVSKYPTFGGYVNFIPDDWECTYLGQLNL